MRDYTEGLTIVVLENFLAEFVIRDGDELVQHLSKAMITGKGSVNQRPMVGLRALPTNSEPRKGVYVRIGNYFYEVTPGSAESVAVMEKNPEFFDEARDYLYRAYQNLLLQKAAYNARKNRKKISLP